MVCRKE